MLQEVQNNLDMLFDTLQSDLERVQIEDDIFLKTPAQIRVSYNLYYAFIEGRKKIINENEFEELNKSILNIIEILKNVTKRNKPFPNFETLIIQKPTLGLVQTNY